MTVIGRWSTSSPPCSPTDCRRSRQYVPRQLTDAVGKVGFSIGVAFWGADAAEMSRLLWFEVAGSGSDLHATDAITINAQASDARRRVGGGPRIRSASVLRFCTM